MNDNTAPDNCQTHLLRLVEPDEFLSARSQVGELEGFVEHIQSELNELDFEVQNTLHRLKLDTRARFIDLKNEILSTRSALSHQFTLLVEIQSMDKYAVRAAISRVDRMLSRLSKTIHPRLEALLQPLAPERELVPNFVARLFSTYNRIASKSPESLQVIVDFYSLKCLAQNKAIYEVYRKDLEAALCGEDGSLSRPSDFRKQRRKLKRRLRIIDIPLAQIVTSHFLEYKESPADSLSEEHRTIHAKVTQDMYDTWRAIRFNLEEVMAEFEDILDVSLEMTSDELAQRIQEPEQLVLDGLEKAAESFDAIAERYFEFIDHLYTSILQDGNYSLSSLQQQLDRILHLKETPRLSRFHLAYRTSFLLHRVNRKISINVDGLSESHRALWVRMEELFKKGIEKLRQRKTPHESLLRLTDLPTTQEVSSSSRNLPSIYRRLFSQKPLLDQDLVVCRESQVSAFMEIFQRWKKGGESSVAIIGQEGSGKKTLLNVLEAEIEDQAKVNRFTITERLRSEQDVIRTFENWFEIEENHDSLDELVNTLQALPRQVLFVEFPHKLLLRSIGLRKAPYAFLYIVLATRSRFLWVIPFKLYPWQRLSYLFEVSRYFTHQIHIDFHDAEEIREAIILRQRSSQYALSFDHNVENKQIDSLLSRHAPDSEPVQTALANLYFKELYSLSGGNMKSALYYWLYSAKFVADTQKIEIAPCIHIDTRFIGELDRLYMFTLGEIINHGEMSTSEHAEIFNVNPFISRSRLEYLRHIRLLEATRFGRNQLPSSYVLNPVFFNPVVTVLNAQHILY